MYVKRVKPLNKILDKISRESILVTTPGTNIHAIVITKFSGDFGASTSPISIFTSNKNSICTRVTPNIMRIRFTSRTAMMGILLVPSAVFIFEVDIIAESLLHAPLEIRPLSEKSRIAPVFIEPHCFRNAHDENKKSLTFLHFATSTNHPIPDSSSPSDFRLTGSERADAKKRIWRKAVIPGNDI